MTSYIPAGSRTLTPSLVMKNGAVAIDFYVSIVGAEELSRMYMPDGLVGHVELRIGDSPFMLADEFPDMGFLGPESIGGSPVTLFIYVVDVDSVYALQSLQAPRCCNSSMISSTTTARVRSAIPSAMVSSCVLFALIAGIHGYVRIDLIVLFGASERRTRI